MTTILLSLLGQFWPIILAALGFVGALLYGRRTGAQAERNRTRAKEADAYEKHLKDIADAADARNSVSPDSMPDDPYRRR